MVAKVLTASAVKKLQPGSRRIEVPDGGSRGSGLRLVVQVSGHKSFAMRFRRPDGRSANLTLGPADLSGAEMGGEPVIGQPLTLAAARKLAADISRDRALGRDVIADRNVAKRRRRAERDERSANAFAPLAKKFITEYARPKTRSWAATARFLGLSRDLQAIPGGLADRWAARPVAEISSDDVHHLVDEIRKRGVPDLVRRREGDSDSLARVSLARLSKFLSWLIERRLVDKNPCTGVWRPDASTPRDRVLSDDEIRWFWRASGELGEPFSAMLRLLLLTGQRRGEVAGMRWDELSEDLETWSLPSARTKNKRAHVVPLSRAVRELIAGVRRVGTVYVFSTDGERHVSSWSRIKQRLDEKMLALARAEKATAPPWRLHDVRRTCASGLQRLGVPIEITERTLNHVGGSFAGIVGVYQRHQYADEKRAALQQWADYVEGLVATEKKPPQRAAVWTA